MSAASKSTERFDAIEAQFAALIASSDVQIKALQERVTALEALLARHETEGLVPLAHEVRRAHTRIDAAAQAFKRIAPPQRGGVEQRLSRVEWDRALADLRDEAAEAGSTQTYFDRAAVVERHRTLALMEAQRQQAAA